MSGVLFLLPGTTVQDVAAAVVAQLLPAVPVAGSVGERLARVDALLSSRATPADVDANVTTAVAREVPPAVTTAVAPTNARLDARLDVAVSTRATKADVNVQVYSTPVPEGEVH